MLKDSMRILHVLPQLSHLGGVERYVMDLLHSFPDHYVCSNGGCFSESLNERHISLPVHSKNLFVILKNKILIQNIVENKNIEIAHVHSRAPAWSMGGLSIPWISTFHGIYGCENILKKTYNKAMLKGSAVIAPSNFVKNHIEETYQTQTPIKTILQGIDTDHFTPQYVTPESLWGIQKKVILLVGRFTKLKGHEVLIHATKDLDAAVVLMGTQNGKENYVNHLKKIAHNNVLFMDEMIDPRPAYAAAHIVVSCSTEPETFGRTTAEALSMARIFVGTDLGATPELCQNLSVLTPPGNSEALHSALKTLLSVSYDFDYRARRHAVAHLSHKNMIFNLDKFYKKIIKQRYW